MRKWKIGILFPAGIRRPCGSPPCQSHIATSLGPHTSSGGLGGGFRPIWGVLYDDEDTSGSLPEFIDAANDVQSTGTILEDGVAPDYCDVGSPDTAGGDLGCSDNSGSNHVAVADSSTTEAP